MLHERDTAARAQRCERGQKATGFGAELLLGYGFNHLQIVSVEPERINMPTHRDHPWLRDQQVMRTPLDPDDPKISAMLHKSKQLKAIDEAREATSTPPPGNPPQP